MGQIRAKWLYARCCVKPQPGGAHALLQLVTIESLMQKVIQNKQCAVRTCTTRYRPGMVKDWWCSYWPMVSFVPAISWNVDVMMKSLWFIAITSAVNWQPKW